jgi:hypothetical protein
MGLNCTPLYLFFFFTLIRFGASSKFLNWWKGKGSCICICAAAITCTGLLYLLAFQTYYKSEFAQIPNQQKISSPRHITGNQMNAALLWHFTTQPGFHYVQLQTTWVHVHISNPIKEKKPLWITAIQLYHTNISCHFIFIHLIWSMPPS